MATDMDVLNLSIGGPDYLDLPFVEKVLASLLILSICLLTHIVQFKRTFTHTTYYTNV